jgi:hypothetical protein
MMAVVAGTVTIMYATFVIWLFRNDISNIIAVGVERGIRNSREDKQP